MESLTGPHEAGGPVSPQGAGPPRHCGTWPGRWPGRAIRSAPPCPRGGRPAPWAGLQSAGHGQDPCRQPRFRLRRPVPAHHTTAGRFLEQGLPVVSVEAKRKEPVGGSARPGRRWRPQGRPVTVPDRTPVTCWSSHPPGL
ncbi:hypothetical protein [Streptomyces sp. NPDC096030]|uniref:ISAzo13-like element transposase-related protein n=1 Tax=Streptomyces sp. NPDC096030 TaxID=3155423 RepID=UPI00331E3269